MSVRSTSVRSITGASPTDPSAGVVPAGTNVVIVRGLLRRVPQFRVLPSGDELLSCDVTVRSDSGPAETIPVVWLQPTAAAGRLAEADEVVVIGRVRRRFFRAAGATASRTEVCADRIIPVRSVARVRTAVGSALCEIDLA